jgi:hypothetical protein
MPKALLLLVLLLPLHMAAQKKKLPDCRNIKEQLRKYGDAILKLESFKGKELSKNDGWSTYATNEKLCNQPGEFEDWATITTVAHILEFEWDSYDYDGSEKDFDALAENLLTIVKETFGSEYQYEESIDVEAGRIFYDSFLEKGKKLYNSKKQIKIVRFYDENTLSVSLRFIRNNRY